MGEYEPEDSRNVTQSTHRAPGEPERTGPRENQSGGKPEASNQATGGSGAGARGAGRAATAHGNPDRQDMQAQPGGPLAGNQRQATDNPAGSATPSYDQYELNQPQNTRRQGAEQAAGAGGTSSAKSERSSGESTSEELRDAQQRGYGGRGEAAARDRKS